FPLSRLAGTCGDQGASRPWREGAPERGVHLQAIKRQSRASGFELDGIRTERGSRTRRCVPSPVAALPYRARRLGARLLPSAKRGRVVDTLSVRVAPSAPLSRQHRFADRIVTTCCVVSQGATLAQSLMH